MILYFNMYKNIEDYLLKTNSDVVIGFSTNINVMLGKLKKKFKGILISSEHAQYMAHGRIVRILKRIYYKKLACTVCLNETDKKLYKKFLMNVECIPNSLTFNTEEYSTLENKLVFSAGRLHKDKGFDMLLLAFKNVVKKYPDWKLEIAGEGEQKYLLEKIILENKLEKNVVLSPFYKDIKSKLKEASIYCLSSRQECFPMVLIEAMSIGLAVVSFDSPNGPRDIICNNEDGILIKPYEIEDFSNAIIFLIENVQIRKDIGKNARNNVKRYSENEIGKLWEKLFIDLREKN